MTKEQKERWLLTGLLLAIMALGFWLLMSMQAGALRPC